MSEQFNNRWTWILFEDKGLQIYSQRRNGLYYILQSSPSNVSNTEVRWLDDEYLHINLIWDNSNNKDYPSCFYILEDVLGDSCIIDLLNKKVILDKFDFADYTGGSLIYTKEFGCNAVDAYVRFVSRKNKTVSLYSIVKGFVFGPVHYEEIELYKNGFLLDQKTLFNTRGGLVEDVTGYVKEPKVENVYYNEEKENCILIIDYVTQLHIKLFPDEDDVFKFEGRYENEEYVYDMNSQELKKEIIHPEYNDSSEGWSAADSYYAYEGHSELELGL